MDSEHRTLEQYANMAELLARVDNDRELLMDLLMLFQTDFPKLREALTLAVVAGDPTEVEKAAHALKGMLANLSIKHASQLVANIELAARTGDDQRIGQAMAGFDLEAPGLVAAVESFVAGREP